MRDGRYSVTSKKFCSLLRKNGRMEGWKDGVMQMAESGFKLPRKFRNLTNSFLFIKLSLVLLILLLGGNFAIAEDDEYTVYVSEDAQVRDKYSETNYGSDDTLGVGKYSTWGLYRSWLKFDLTNLTLPEGTTVASAELHIYHHSHRDVDPSEEVGVYEGNDNWSEGSITWSSQPSFSSSASDTTETPTYDWYTLDVTSPAKTAYEGDGALSLVLRSENESGEYWAGFRSKEYNGGSHKAYLTVTATPEPATILLFGTGLVGLAWCLRRRNKPRNRKHK